MAEAEPSTQLEPVTVLAGAALLLSVFPVVAVGFSTRQGPYAVQTYLFWSDLPLIALGLVSLPALARRLLARRLDIVTSLVVLVTALTVAWAVHPSIRGFLQVLRFLGVAGAVLAVDRGGRPSRLFLGGLLAVVTTLEAVIAVAQMLSGGPVGLRSLGEQARPLLPIGGADAPFGTLVHPYVLAGLAVVTIAVLVAVALHDRGRARAVAVAVAAAGVIVGVTYSRMALLALLALLVPLVLATRSRATRPAALVVGAALLLGAGLAGLAASDGWVGRAEEAATGTNLSRGRSELAAQAVAVIRAHPLAGVGTGRYVTAVEEDPDLARRSVRVLQPVHGVPLLLVAEGGVLVAAALVLLVVALGRAALRGGVAAWALLLAYLPFLVLDHFPVTFPQGLVITAVWLAALQALTGADAADDDETSAAAPVRARASAE